MKIKKKKFYDMLECQRAKGFADGFECGVAYARDNELQVSLVAVADSLKRSVSKALEVFNGEDQH